MHSRGTFPNCIQLDPPYWEYFLFEEKKKKRYCRVGRTKNGNTSRNNIIVQNVTAGKIKGLR